MSLDGGQTAFRQGRLLYSMQYKGGGRAGAFKVDLGEYGGANKRHTITPYDFRLGGKGSVDLHGLVIGATREPTARMQVKVDTPIKELIAATFKEYYAAFWNQADFPADAASYHCKVNETRLSEMEESIISAAKTYPPSEGLRVLSSAWNHLTRTKGVVEAQTRKLIRKVVPPPQASEAPSWFTEGVATLQATDKDSGASTRSAIESAMQIVLACSTIASERSISAEVEKAPFGEISIRWNLEDALLHWTIRAPQVQWPAVDVTSLYVPANINAKGEVRHFNVSMELIEHLARAISGNGQERAVQTDSTASGIAAPRDSAGRNLLPEPKGG